MSKSKSLVGLDNFTNRWGAEDQLGAANLMTEQSVLNAVKLARRGKVYSLGMILDSKFPMPAPRSLSLTIMQPGEAYSGLGPNKMTYNDDMFVGWLGIGSQIDGLGHAGVDNVYYGKRKGGDFAKTDGLTELGIENLPGLVGRGVLLDMAKFYGQEILDESAVYTEEDIKAAAEQQGVEIREGDVVLFHSGWLNLLEGENADPERFGSVEPGLGISGGEYLARIGVMAVGADTWGVDAVPADDGQPFRGHQILIAEHGIYLLENMNTRELAADGVYEFLFILGQPRLRGAAQMMINPIAIR